MVKTILAKLFQEYDKDNSGFIDSTEVRALLEAIYKDAGVEVE